MSDHAQLAALQTERAYLLETSKNDRAAQVDEQIEAVRARINAAAAASIVETTTVNTPAAANDPEETTKSRRGRPPKAKADAASPPNE